MEKSPLKVGKTILAMTPTTHYWVGRVVEINLYEIVLEKSSWIPDLGRHNEAISKGSFNEVECHGDCLISIPRPGTVVIEWNHELPTTSK